MIIYKFLIYHIVLYQNVIATPKLNHALVRDILPPSSSKCGPTGLTSFNFNFTLVNSTASNWNSLHRHQEKEVFLAEILSGLDPETTDHGWKIRVGQAGVIYSFIGAFGEAVPPQGGVHSPWNDEVWQQTMTNRPKNNPDSGGLYMIHQAGVYLYDDALTGIYPSPNALGSGNAFLDDPGAAISCEENSCAFVSWGQHAHIPTPHHANALYYTRVADCGNGVVEFSMVTHNMKVSPRNTSDFFDFYTTPWMAVRGETFRDILVTKVGASAAALVKPTPIFRENSGVEMGKTLGYTVFTQGISDDEVLPAFEFPCVDRNNSANNVECTGDPKVDRQPILLCAKSDPCSESVAHSNIYGKPVIRCLLKDTVDTRFGSPYGDLLLYNNKDPSNTLHIGGILSWAINGRLFMFIADTISAMYFVNRNFKIGEALNFRHTDIGYPYEANHALTVIHGTYNNAKLTDYLPGDWSSSIIVFGLGASITRDLIVFGACHRNKLLEGETFRERSFYITDKLGVIDKRAQEWVPEKYRDKIKAEGVSGQEVILFKNSPCDTFFGGCLATEMCGQDKAPVTCKGWTTPKQEYFAHFAMKCGRTRYVGTDRYHFAPVDNISGYKRNYICINEPVGTKPSYHLLGYFRYGDCDAFQNDAFDQLLCNSVL